MGSHLGQEYEEKTLADVVVPIITFLTFTFSGFSFGTRV